jgi:uncharacterized membrane protein
MWLKCVLYLQVLHAFGYVALELLLALELTPVEHLILTTLSILIITHSLLLLPAGVAAERPHLQGYALVHVH